MNGKTVRAWIQASRLPFFIATIVPILTGWILSIHERFNLLRLFIVLAGALAVHLATNLANDYFDYLQGTDSGEAIGGSRVIQENKIPPGTIKVAVILLLFLAFILAIATILWLKLYLLIFLVLFAAFSAIFYVAPPIRYGYHGLGELFVGINMGPVMVVGTYWVMSGNPAMKPLFISIPIGVMVAAILYYQSLPDMQTDKSAGKYTLAVKLGKKGAYLGLIMFFIAIYGSIACLVMTDQLSWTALFSLTTVAVAVRLLGIVRHTTDWVLLDQYGRYMRIIYCINGLAIMTGSL